MELTEQDIHQKQEEPVHRDLTGVNVLMAEDNDLNAELATVMLEDAGMVVTRASDGKEAVERFKNHPRGTYDIILMDIMMPNMDGHQAAKTIRAMEKERPDASSIPIIALSANAFAEDVKASVDSGMNGHISKPFDMEEVTATIENTSNLRTIIKLLCGLAEFHAILVILIPPVLGETPYIFLKALEKCSWFG